MHCCSAPKRFEDKIFSLSFKTLLDPPMAVQSPPNSAFPDTVGHDLTAPAMPSDPQGANCGCYAPLPCPNILLVFPIFPDFLKLLNSFRDFFDLSRIKRHHHIAQLQHPFLP